MNLIKSSLANLKGHKLRVFITLLWIVMGITSVILVSSIGNGLKKEVEISVNKVNPNKTRIYFEATDPNMMIDFLNPFTYSDLESLAFIEGVEKIGSSDDDFDFGSISYLDAKYDKKTTYINIKKFEENIKLKPIYGRNFAIEDENRKVVLITMQNATDLFNEPEDALGKGITINGNTYEVIGIVDESSWVNKEEINNNLNVFWEEPINAYMPAKAYDGLNSQYSYSSQLYDLSLVVSKGYDVFEVADKVIAKLYELHPDIEGSYNVIDPTDATKELQSMISMINKFVTLITAISMFVGGVGVMNIMYVSVMERQREIGIRRAIGAKPRAILFQFLIESVFITVCGGILGIIVGFIVVNYASNYLPYQPIPNANSFLFASVATVATGIIFGIVPAIKASKLDPIKAIYK